VLTLRLSARGGLSEGVFLPHLVGLKVARNEALLSFVRLLVDAAPELLPAVELSLFSKQNMY